MIIWTVFVHVEHFIDCKTAVFFANASDGPYYGRVRLARFTLEDHAYGASRRPKTTVLQSTFREESEGEMSCEL